MTEHLASETRRIQTGRNHDYTHGAVNPAVHRGSSFIFPTVATYRAANAQRAEVDVLHYGRRGGHTHFALQKAMVELEGGAQNGAAGCFLYPCGVAAIAGTLLAFLRSEDHLLIVETAYQPVQALCQQVLKDLKVEVEYFLPQISSEIGRMMKPNTRLIFVESPGSNTMELVDVPALVESARRVNPEVVIALDNTWGAGVLFQPLCHDVDISIQSGTKYIIGHSDYLIGMAVSNQRCFEQLRDRSYLLGYSCDAESAYQALRGIRTLTVRLRQHELSSLQVATWLQAHPAVEAVFHVALPSFPGHNIFQRDFHGSNGLFSFRLHRRLTDSQFCRMLDGLQLFKMAFSWGGFESLILGYQAEEIDAQRLATQKVRQAVEAEGDPVPSELQLPTGTFFRVHIGLEDVKDLIADLESALERAK